MCRTRRPSLSPLARLRLNAHVGLGKNMKTLAKVALAFLLVFGLLLGGCHAYFWWLTHPVTRTSAYARIKTKRWAWKPELVSHFPREIPSAAQDCRFYFRPGFLQGGSTMELRMRLPADEVLDLHRKYSAIAKLSIRGDAELDRTSGNPDNFPKSEYHSFPQEDVSSTNWWLAALPGDFQMFLLSSRPYQTNPISWNHGDACGISVSTDRNEVIYWVEAW